LRDVIKQIQNIWRHHAHLVNDERAREEPSAHHLWPLTNMGGDCCRRVLAETNSRPTVNRLCLFAEEQGSAARQRRHGNLLAFILKFLFDLMDEEGFARATRTCQKDIVTFKNRVQSDLLTLIELHLFRVV